LEFWPATTGTEGTLIVDAYDSSDNEDGVARHGDGGVSMKNRKDFDEDA
jgi:hypothetical protein